MTIRMPPWPYAQATYEEYDVAASGGDYTSLSAFISAHNTRDFTAAGDNVCVVANCHAFEDDGNGLQLYGATTDTSHFWIVRAVDDHGGKWNPNCYILTRDDMVTGNYDLRVRDNNGWLIGLQASYATTGTDQNNMSALHVWGQTAAGHIQFDRCITKFDGITSGTARWVKGISVNNNNPTFIVRNCLSYDFTLSGGSLPTVSTGFYGAETTGGTHYFENNTCINCYVGFSYNTNLYLYNNLYDSQGLSSADGFYDWGGSGPAGADYNASDLAGDAPGSNSRNSQTFTFRDEANDDFHLDPDDKGARGWGTDLGSATYPVVEDIDRESRIAADVQKWDIGADQYIPPRVTPPRHRTRYTRVRR